MSIELPVATRYRRDMTEKLLKATFNPNTHTHPGSSCEKMTGSNVINVLKGARGGGDCVPQEPTLFC